MPVEELTSVKTICNTTECKSSVKRRPSEHKTPRALPSQHPPLLPLSQPLLTTLLLPLATLLAIHHADFLPTRFLPVSAVAYASPVPITFARARLHSPSRFQEIHSSASSISANLDESSSVPIQRDYISLDRDDWSSPPNIDPRPPPLGGHIESSSSSSSGASEPLWMHSGKFQGDIDGVDLAELKTLTNPAAAGASGGGVQFNALRNKQLTWPSGVIPYVLDPAFTPAEARLLRSVFHTYRQRTCIRFRPRRQSQQQMRRRRDGGGDDGWGNAGDAEMVDFDYLNIVKGHGCYSQVGRTGGKQEISLGRGCLFNETITHELMHAIGFWHEHSRADRDEHITIRWPNILPGMDGQFDIVSAAIQDTLGERYDYLSIMHYGSTAFSRNGHNTIEAAVPSFTNLIGTAVELSQLDEAKIRKLYRCPKRQPPSKPAAAAAALEPIDVGSETPETPSPTTLLPMPLPLPVSKRRGGKKPSALGTIVNPSLSLDRVDAEDGGYGGGLLPITLPPPSRRRTTTLGPVIRPMESVYLPAGAVIDNTPTNVPTASTTTTQQPPPSSSAEETFEEAEEEMELSRTPATPIQSSIDAIAIPNSLPQPSYPITNGGGGGGAVGETSSSSIGEEVVGGGGGDVDSGSSYEPHPGDSRGTELELLQPVAPTRGGDGDGGERLERGALDGHCEDHFSDCPAFSDYCHKAAFRFVMKSYCPHTCGYCPSAERQHLNDDREGKSDRSSRTNERERR